MSEEDRHPLARIYAREVSERVVGLEESLALLSVAEETDTPRLLDSCRAEARRRIEALATMLGEDDMDWRRSLERLGVMEFGARRLTMLEKVSKFTGIPSGDAKGFCFDVTQGDYERVVSDVLPTGVWRVWQRSCAYKDLFRLYPGHLTPVFDPDVLYDIEVTVRMAPVGKAKPIEE